jgi:hypothetical protein
MDTSDNQIARFKNYIAAVAALASLGLAYRAISPNLQPLPATVKAVAKPPKPVYTIPTPVKPAKTGATSSETQSQPALEETITSEPAATSQTWSPTEQEQALMDKVQNILSGQLRDGLPITEYDVDAACATAMIDMRLEEIDKFIHNLPDTAENESLRKTLKSGQLIIQLDIEMHDPDATSPHFFPFTAESPILGEHDYIDALQMSGAGDLQILSGGNLAFFHRDGRLRFSAFNNSEPLDTPIAFSDVGCIGAPADLAYIRQHGYQLFAKKKIATFRCAEGCF